MLDWAGTTVDFGSRAPIIAIRRAFEAVGVPVSEEEARQPMGRAKRDHLSTMLAQPALAKRWQAKFGSVADESAIDRIYHEFLALQAECVAQYSAVIEGCIAAIDKCRDRGVKIGSSTGYTRELLSKVADRAAAEGYRPDVMLSADDVSPGRPAPWLCVENARRLGVDNLAAVVKVDDTPAGVRAGRNAGAWSVGVVCSGNEVGLSEEALAALADDERASRVHAAQRALTEAGAHLLIDTIDDLPAAIDRIDGWLAERRRP